VTELSVIIPTKNRPGLLERALRSFRGAPADLEIIVVDDGTTPEFAAENQSVCTDAVECRYLRFSRSRGAPAARNHGFVLSRGNYVWFVDDDDYVAPQTVRDVLERVRSPGGGGEVLLLPRSRLLEGTRIWLDIPVEESDKLERYRRFGIEVTTSCAVFPRELVSKINGWDESLRALQDTDLFLRAAHVATFTCLKTEPVCVDYGHPTRISFSFGSSQVGKLQFLRKHWQVLPLRRKLRLLASVVLCAPLTRNLRLRWRLRSVRAGGTPRPS
jgi:glycosyltransferase involved in cell wall biosynthesis